MDSACSHEIKRYLLLGRKATSNLNSVLKAETSLCWQRSVLSKLWFFQQSCMDVRVGPWRRLSTKELVLFELWLRLLRVPWTARRSNQSILKEINPEYSLDGLMLKLKLQYFGHVMWRVTWCPEPTHWKRRWCWERLKAKGEEGGRWWYGEIASLTQWTWTWAHSGS